jgi:hypothetical protein
MLRASEFDEYAGNDDSAGCARGGSNSESVEICYIVILHLN